MKKFTFKSVSVFFGKTSGVKARIFVLVKYIKKWVSCEMNYWRNKKSWLKTNVQMHSKDKNMSLFKWVVIKSIIRMPLFTFRIARDEKPSKAKVFDEITSDLFSR